MTRMHLLAWAALAFSAAQAVAGPYPEYTPQHSVSGLIRTWGHDSRALVAAWEDGFRVHQPGVRFEATLKGDSTAIGGLYTGAAEVALMERTPIAIELDAYQPIFKHDPVEVSVATGSLDVRDRAPALAVFVHRTNPLARLTLAELDAVIGADRRRGAKPVRTWGDLGLTGAWARKPVTIYVPEIASTESQYMEKAVMGGSQKWAGRLREFKTGQQVLDALASDKYAIAVSAMASRNAGVRPLALAAVAGGPYIAPTRATVAARSYPLTRTVSMFFNQADPALKEYLRYILSDQGQAAVAREGKYFPLSPEASELERSKLR